MHVSNAATKAILCEKAEEKWRAYYSNLYYPEQNYLLVYEDGQIVNFLPGTNEPFSLKRYLCLCTTEDHNRMFMKDFESDSENEPPPLKCAKRDTNSTLEDENQIKFDEDLARQLESDIEWESMANENCVTEALPLGEVVVIEDSNIHKQ